MWESYFFLHCSSGFSVLQTGNTWHLHGPWFQLPTESFFPEFRSHRFWMKAKKGWLWQNSLRRKSSGYWCSWCSAQEPASRQSASGHPHLQKKVSESIKQSETWPDLWHLPFLWEVPEHSTENSETGSIWNVLCSTVLSCVWFPTWWSHSFRYRHLESLDVRSAVYPSASCGREPSVWLLRP